LEDTYRTISIRSQGLYKDKGSKFIAHAIPVNSEDEIKQELEQLKKEYYDARHHCYAYILGFDRLVYRMNDDGEPSGTAGKPIYGQLQTNDLTNTLVVVIRYFGGTKLGVRGLIDAYKYATMDALQQNQIETRIINDVFELKFDYVDMNDVMRIMKDEGLKQTDQDFQMTCSLVFEVRKANSEKVCQRFRDLRKVNIDIEWLRTE